MSPRDDDAWKQRQRKAARKELAARTERQERAKRAEAQLALAKLLLGKKGGAA